MKKTDRAAFFTLTFTLHRFKRLSAMFLLGVLCLSLTAGCGGEEAAPGLTLGVIADLAGQKEGREPEAALSEDLAFYYGVQHAVNGAIAENARPGYASGCLREILRGIPAACGTRILLL